MTQSAKAVRQSVSLPDRVAKDVHAIAKKRNVSANRVIVDLIKAGLQAKEEEKQRFFDLANRLTETEDPEEREQLKEQLARLTFGD